MEGGSKRDQDSNEEEKNYHAQVTRNQKQTKFNTIDRQEPEILFQH